MKPQPPFNRRRFLTTAAASATLGALLNSGSPMLRAAPPNTTGETEHFWYRLAPEGPASTSTCGFVYSPDMGQTWAQYDLKEFGPRSGCRFHKKNGDGWFRVDLRKGWIDRAEVLFIKPKP